MMLNFLSFLVVIIKVKMLTSYKKGYKAATLLQHMCTVRMFAVYP